MPKQKTVEIIPDERIFGRIFYIRGEKVMFDRDIAELYNVKTKELNKAVKRNIERFPEDFMFQLTKSESDMFLRFQNGTLENGGRGKYAKYLPYVFTEQGVAMLSAVLKSRRAIEVSIQIVRVFIKMRKLLATHKDLRDKIEKMEKENKENFKVIFKVISKLMVTNPEKGESKVVGFTDKKRK
ncbi:MAG: hypothetical protein US57_C0014G0024 [Candidatus Moranbacteria bacterium GW2011_GWC2_37_73]|nr:MAG: hypothetical protein UR95_C0002G0044 [Parcubacteria group bacterium GW2011_GWC1_36_108]KKQ39401.1 MAG: hypothetical protein US57_C0014G0024 [Candidatus Moranbacteria bacterium GW2011_GWC2_37_73]HAS00062.1 DNA-binding protein [Candidatus Moranbacteria bacterium]HBI50713.1 DNA-binding protein [Candidatus Moranbacteria bacterium]HBU10786.1 DNA-binding protein [Candidatus Moranbacteria bacterium]